MDAPSNPKEFPWRGIAYPTFALLFLWATIFLPPLFGVTYGHAAGGLILWFALIPGTVIAEGLIVVRLPRALMLLLDEPRLQTAASWLLVGFLRQPNLLD
jgi:hypothetical protein